MTAKSSRAARTQQSRDTLLRCKCQMRVAKGNQGEFLNMATIPTSEILNSIEIVNIKSLASVSTWCLSPIKLAPSKKASVNTPSVSSILLPRCCAILSQDNPLSNAEPTLCFERGTAHPRRSVAAGVPLQLHIVAGVGRVGAQDPLHVLSDEVDALHKVDVAGGRGPREWFLGIRGRYLEGLVHAEQAALVVKDRAARVSKTCKAVVFSVVAGLAVDRAHDGDHPACDLEGVAHIVGGVLVGRRVDLVDGAYRGAGPLSDFESRALVAVLISQIREKQGYIADAVVGDKVPEDGTRPGGFEAVEVAVREALRKSSRAS